MLRDELEVIGDEFFEETLFVREEECSAALCQHILEVLQEQTVKSLVFVQHIQLPAILVQMATHIILRRYKVAVII